MEVLEDGRPLSGVVDDGRVGGRFEDVTILWEEAGTKKELARVGDGGWDGYPPSVDDLYEYELVNGIEA